MITMDTAAYSPTPEPSTDGVHDAADAVLISSISVHSGACATTVLGPSWPRKTKMETATSRSNLCEKLPTSSAALKNSKAHQSPRKAQARSLLWISAQVRKYTKSGLHIPAEYSDQMDSILQGGTGDGVQFLPVSKAVEIFKRMKDEDCKAARAVDITWARPEWLLVQVLLIPPLHVRPSVNMGGGSSTSEDDLTH
eukprot:CAMPEP_0197236274 /NCGR_PEP_ID=MMETSP1429-20130617/3442_1 /TAXON_ID=49237 /ORGANISM="Chaetoceros  sp., Strain UNC1202" /LENGTH=195 /DNA_ID=CAMNT_0042695029 /DNA_START=52 /DNA_END=639 /DNA_ORIENTATION=-